MKRLSYLFFLISFLLIRMPKAESAEQIENVAETTYLDSTGAPYRQPSGIVITEKEIPANLGVRVNVPVPVKAGQKSGTSLFPATVTNTGIVPDSYKLIIEGLAAGLESSIYHDLNGN